MCICARVRFYQPTAKLPDPGAVGIRREQTHSVPVVAILTTMLDDVKVGMSYFNPVRYDSEMRRQWAHE
jgi:hypothetical protein